LPLDTFTLSTTKYYYNGSTKLVSILNCSGGGITCTTYTTSGTWSSINGGTFTAKVTGNGNFSGTLSAKWYIYYQWYMYYATLTGYSLPYSHNDSKRETTYDSELRCSYYANYSFNSSTGAITLSNISYLPASAGASGSLTGYMYFNNTSKLLAISSYSGHSTSSSAGTASVTWNGSVYVSTA